MNFYYWVGYHLSRLAGRLLFRFRVIHRERMTPLRLLGGFAGTQLEIASVEQRLVTSENKALR